MVRSRHDANKDGKVERGESEGAGHGGPQFSAPARYELVKNFLDRHIKQVEVAD